MHLNTCGLWHKSEEIKQLLEENRIDILGVSETYLGTNDQAPKIRGYKWYGDNGTRKERGVGIYIKERIYETVKIATEDSEGRITAINCQGLTILETYSPVDCSSKEVKENYHRNLTTLLAKIMTKTNKVILMGDFNAHITGFASEKTNSNGKMLLNTINATGMILLEINEFTFLGRNGRPTCIDYFAITDTLKKHASKITTIKNTITNSDHLPILLALETDTNEICGTNKRESFKINLLDCPLKKQKYQERLNQLLNNQNLDKDPAKIYEDCVNAMKIAAIEILGLRQEYSQGKFKLNAKLREMKKEAKKSYIAAIESLTNGNIKDFSDLIKTHRQIHKDFKQEYRKEKRKGKIERELEIECANMTECWRMYQNLKKMKSRQSLILSPNEANKIQDWWQNTYSDEEETYVENKPDECTIFADEVKNAIAQMGNRKATGPDGIPCELIKYGGNIMEKIITALIRKIWQTNTVPIEMKKAYIILIPKKKDSNLPQDMRPITLLNSMYKLLDKIITSRLQTDLKNKEIMNEAQAGFTKSRSCPGQIFTLNTIIDLRKKKNQPTFCAYLDLAKAFDSVNRKLLFETMEMREVDKNIIRILKQMYAGEESAIIMNN